MPFSISLFLYTGGRTSEILRNKYLKTVAKLKVISAYLEMMLIKVFLFELQIIVFANPNDKT